MENIRLPTADVSTDRIAVAGAKPDKEHELPKSSYVPVKILFLNYEYPPLGGGAANATRYLTREFATRADVEVHLVTSGLGPKRRIEHIGKNVHVHFLPIGKDESNLHRQSQKELLTYGWAAWGYASKLVRDAEREGHGFDVTLAFFGVPCGALALGLKLRYGLPYVVSLRGSDVPGYSEKFDRIYWILKPIIKAVWRGARAVAPNSRGLAELAAATSPKQKFDIIPNGVDTDMFRPPAESHPDGSFIITNGATRLTPRKGMRYLIEAMPLILDRYPEVRLRLIGGGEERPSLEALVQKLGLGHAVTFLGQLSADETYRYYQEADVFVLPSLNEGMSNAMLEALASGLPIVATATGGTDEVVTDGENGFFVKQQSPEDLAEKLSRLIGDEELRVRMGGASRKRAEGMNWKAVADRFLESVKGDVHPRA